MLLENYQLLKNSFRELLDSSLLTQSILQGEVGGLVELYNKAEHFSETDRSMLSSIYLFEKMIPHLKTFNLEFGCVMDQNAEFIDLLQLINQIKTYLINPQYLEAKSSFSKTLLDSINHYTNNNSGLIGEFTEKTAMEIRVSSFEDFENLKAYPVLNCYDGAAETIKYRKMILVGRSRDDLLTEALNPDIPDSIMLAATVGAKSANVYFVLKSQGNIVLYQDVSKISKFGFLRIIKDNADRILMSQNFGHLDISMLGTNALTWVSLMFSLILETVDINSMVPAYFIGDVLSQSSANAVRKFKHHQDSWLLPPVTRDEILAEQVNKCSDVFNFHVPDELMWLEHEFAHLVNDECLNLMGLRSDKYYFDVTENRIVKNPALDVGAALLGDKSKHIPLLHLPLNDYADLQTIRKIQLNAARTNFAEILKHHIQQASNTQLKEFKNWINRNIRHSSHRAELLETVKNLVGFFKFNADEPIKLDADSHLLRISEMVSFKHKGVDNAVFGTLNFTMQPETPFIREHVCVVTCKKPTHALVVKCHSLNDLQCLLGSNISNLPQYTDKLFYNPELNEYCALNAKKAGFINGFSLFKTPITITIPLTKTGIKTLLS